MRSFNYLIGIAAFVAAGALMPQMASADKVCKEVCAAGVCKQECIETEGRGERREERRDVIIERERREAPRPGIELRVPAPSIRVEPPHS